MENFIMKEMKKEDLTFTYEIWGKNLKDHFCEYIDQKGYFPFIVKSSKEMAGVCQILINDTIGWLGMIVVNEPFRRKGIGQMMTDQLIKKGWESECQTQALFATEMGEPLYKKLGFETDQIYVKCIPPESLPPLTLSDHIIPYHPDYHSKILELDYQTTGEKRECFLSLFLKSGYVYFDHEGLKGYFLPNLGQGLIIAKEPMAGFALMNFKMSFFGKIFFLPEKNQEMIAYLLSLKYTVTDRIPRMILGKNPHIMDENIYCRGSGFSG